MSVLIKGMKMPQSGYVDVRIFAEGHANIAVAYKPFYEELPVIEIPPHGRLIDADAFLETLNPIKFEDALLYARIDRIKTVTINRIKDEPTVIEADGRYSEKKKRG